MEQEEWRPVEGFPEYMVSDQGRIVSHHNARRPKELVGGLTAKVGGYRFVTLTRSGGHQKNVTLHSVVAAAFLGPRPDGLVILHGDGNRLNNAASNLRYGTQAENERDKVRHGTHHLARKTHCPQGHPYDEENTYRNQATPNKRYCRACMRANNKRRRAGGIGASVSTAVTAPGILTW